MKQGVVHKTPNDLKAKLNANQKALLAWDDITPLARNEWICWIISIKTPETRAKHIKRTVGGLSSGKRRPCCWGGCPHR